MSEIEIDSYVEAAVDTDKAITAQWPAGDGARSFGETFLPTLGYIVTSCKFKLRKSGSPTGTLKAYLYGLAGPALTDIPTGDPLDTSDSIVIEDLTSTYVYYLFTFSGRKVIDPLVPYGLTLYSTDGVLDGSNYVRVGSMAVGTHEGYGLRYLSSFEEWQAYSTIKILFYAYGWLSIMPLYRCRD